MDEIFVKNKGGSAGRRQAPVEAAEPMDMPEVAVEQDKAIKDSQVKVHSLRWSEEKARIGDKISGFASVDLPEDKSHLTRLTFTLFAIESGKPERIDGKETHIANGEASVEFDLFAPHPSGSGVPPSEYTYVFTAKHRNSKDEKSPLISVTLEFDEQMQFLDDESQEPMQDLPFYIECKGNKILSGRTDASGMCPRISTKTQSESLVYLLGDEALAKEDF
ncbi:MAG: hypothetical protein ABI036_03325 [Fibrobacteria bacterium]